MVGVEGRLEAQAIRDNVASSRAEQSAKLSDLGMLRVMKRLDARLCEGRRLFYVDMKAGFKASCDGYLQFGYQDSIMHVPEVE